MKIGNNPNIAKTLVSEPNQKSETHYTFGSLRTPSDSFVRENKPKTNFFSNFFSAIKKFFTRPKEQNSQEQIDISTLKNGASAVSFKGINVSQTKTQITKELGLSEQEISDYLTLIREKSSLDEICATLELYNITPSEFGEEYNRQKEIFDGDAELSLTQTLENLKSYTILSKEPLFEPFKLSMKESEEITSAIIRADYPAVNEILKKNNEKIGTMIEKENLVPRYSGEIYKKLALDDYKMISPDNLADLGIINGRSKKIIFPNATHVESAPEVDVDADTLIKSNIITMELLKATKDVPLPEIKTANAITKDAITLYPEKIREKALKFGIDSLTTFEIHAITDSLRNMPEALKEANKIIKNKSNPVNKQLRQICGYKNHLKKLAEPILRNSRVVIGDHAYLRMLDRNMVSVSDNKQNRLLSFQEFVEVIKNAGEEELKKTSPKDNIEIPNYNGTGIKLIADCKNGTCLIDSVM